MKSQIKYNNWPIALLTVGVLLIIGSVSWYVYFNNRPAETPPASEGNVLDSVPRVSLADAKAAFDTQSAIFLDVRSADAYQISHIPGAISISLNELAQKMATLDKGAWLIPYCT